MNVKGGADFLGLDPCIDLRGEALVKASVYDVLCASCGSCMIACAGAHAGAGPVLTKNIGRDDGGVGVGVSQIWRSWSKTSLGLPLSSDASGAYFEKDEKDCECQGAAFFGPCARRFLVI